MYIQFVRVALSRAGFLFFFTSSFIMVGKFFKAIQFKAGGRGGARGAAFGNNGHK